MSDDTPSISTSSLDQRVDREINTPSIRQEKYKDGVASKHSFDHLTDTSPDKSQTMAEVERVIASDTLTPKDKKLAQFGLNLQHKNDFRLTNFTRRLDTQLNQDYASEIKSGPISARVRQFDVQSQTMRMISANAALSSYQFQKTQVLPFMRKSLALDYQKVGLLKKVVGGIGSMEKSLLIKLEAIKMNTAAIVPKKMGYFGSLMKEVKEQNLKRIAGNISNVMMSKWDAQYKKHVSPILSRIHKAMSDPSPKHGGVNGVLQYGSSQFNRVRHMVDAVAKNNAGKKGVVAGLTSLGTKTASSALGGLVHFGQTHRLSPGLNKFAAGQLQSYTAFADQLKPFASGSPQQIAQNIADNGGRFSLETGDKNSPIIKLIHVVNAWKQDSTKTQTHLLDHVQAIRMHLVSGGLVPGLAYTPHLPAIIPTPSQTGSANARKTLASHIQSIKAKAKLPAVSLPKVHLPKVSLPKVHVSLARKIHDLHLHHADTPHLATAKVKTLVHAVKGQVTSIHHAATHEHKAKAIYDKAKMRHQQMVTKLSGKLAVRKGSYEDIEAHRDQDRRHFPWGKAGATAAAAAGMGAANKTAPQPSSGWGYPSLTEMAGAGLLAGGKSIAKLGWRGSKLLGKQGLRATEYLAPKAATGGFAATKALGRFAAKEAGGVARLGGRGLLGSLKMGGRGAFGLVKGVGRRLPLLGLGLEALDYLTGQRTLNFTNIAKSGLSLGGGAIGGALGGLATAGLGGEFVGGAGGYAAGNWLGNKLFGDDAHTNGPRGAKSEGLLTSIKNGFQKLLFGDKFSNGEYKEGTSLLSMIKTSVGHTLSNFGKSVMAIPGNIKRDGSNFIDRSKKMATWYKDKITQGAKTVGDTVRYSATQVGNAASNVAQGTKDAVTGTKNWASSLTMKNVSETIQKASFYANPVNFTIGASSAIFGWAMNSGGVDNPASPYYAYAGQVLSAYGIKNRDMYKLVHSIETSQEKINNNQTKPFDDSDMAYMAGRFGLDSKNKDAVNYFKLWYKRRFIPALAIITKVLKNHKSTVASALSANEKEIIAITADIRKEVSSSDLMSINLEPSAQAFNKYAKVGSADPGGQASGTNAGNKQFDPRDPKNREQAFLNKLRGSRLNGGSAYGQNNAANDNGGRDGPLKATRSSVKLGKGGVKDQPEYKAAYQKLPPKLKRLVDQSKSLQFVLWSTSFQHGADNASKIFQKDYSDKLDEKGYIKSIYQDRAGRFGDLGADDRIDAVNHLSQEEKFAEGIQNNTDMNSMSQQLTNVVSPDGMKAAAVTGDKASRSKDGLKYLMGKGYSKYAAAGVLGNLLMESGLRTDAKGDSGHAHGIAQWHEDRRSAIAKHFNKSVEAMNFHEQLDAVDWEIRNGAGGKSLFGDLSRAKDEKEASRLIMQKYERPADHASGGQNDRARAALAMGVLKTMDANAPDTSSASTPQTKPSTPATKAAASKTPKVQTPAVAAPVDHSHIKDNTAAIRAHTAAMVKAQNMGGGTGGNSSTNHTTVIAPQTKPANDADGFIAMTMKKMTAIIGD